MIETPRKVPRGERGQSLVLLLLVFVTMVLIGTVAVVVGQTLVRRQQAQMIVDAAALAGASRQAEGLNTIAHFNKLALTFLQMIHVSMYIPYMDGAGTSWSRFVPVQIAPFLWNDWAGKAIRAYGGVFNLYDQIIDLVNWGYSNASPGGPNYKATQVVNDNFGGSSTGDRLFRGENPRHGMIPFPLPPTKQLVKLTKPEKYKVGGYSYVPYPNVATWMGYCNWYFPLPCPWVASYASALAYFPTLSMFIRPISYKLGRFYKDNQSEVRFAYALQVNATPTIFGKNFFEDIPPITVLAAAKPYGGYLGNSYTNMWYLPIGHFTWERSKKISPTYKAKLVPLTAAETTYAWAIYGQSKGTPWTITTLH